MSLKTLVISALLAVSAVATDYSSWGSGGGGSWGGGSSSPSKGSGWGSGSGSGWGAAASCPAGCQPIPTGGAPPPAATTAGELIVQVVSVSDANGSLKYFPNQIEAPVGSVVQFQFHPKNHTVTESSFAAPCKPLAANLTSPTRPGLKSGFVPVTGKEDFTPVFNVLVNDTKPIWIYCGQVNHCEKGMAMVINQNNSSPNTIEKYIANAALIPLVNVTAPTTNASTAVPPPPPPPPAATDTFTFGAGAATSSVAQTPPSPTIAPVSTSTAAQPATFTGAAASLPASHASSALGLVLGALLALW